MHVSRRAEVQYCFGQSLICLRGGHTESSTPKILHRFEVLSASSHIGSPRGRATHGRRPRTAHMHGTRTRVVLPAPSTMVYTIDCGGHEKRAARFSATV